MLRAMSNNVIQTLVPPQRLRFSGDFYAWHGGLVCSPTLLQLAIIIEPYRHHEDDRLLMAPEYIPHSVSVRVAHALDSWCIDLAYGICGGSDPFHITRLADCSLKPGKYRPEIDMPELEIHYIDHFSRLG